MLKCEVKLAAAISHGGVSLESIFVEEILVEKRIERRIEYKVGSNGQNGQNGQKPSQKKKQETTMLYMSIGFKYTTTTSTTTPFCLSLLPSLPKGLARRRRSRKEKKRTGHEKLLFFSFFLQFNGKADRNRGVSNSSQYSTRILYFYIFIHFPHRIRSILAPTTAHFLSLLSTLISLFYFTSCSVPKKCAGETCRCCCCCFPLFLAAEAVAMCWRILKKKGKEISTLVVSFNMRGAAPIYFISFFSSSLPFSS